MDVGCPYETESNVTVFDGDWLEAKKLIVRKGAVTEHWEVISRKKRAANTVAHGVYIVPLIISSSCPTKIILEKQYRLAMNGYVLELPGGLLKEAESPEQTAERELWEETGYSGKAVKVSAGICTEGAPVMFNTCKFVTVHVDGDRPENTNPRQNLPPAELEHISVVIVPLEQLDATLQQHADQGVYIMGELHTLALGLSLAGKIGI
uniref:Nudix hydrolase domain-containing protein n=1 Tax=Plectus sambesii TaxID=2011161 RepID=A0A914VSL6_9BILA